MQIGKFQSRCLTMTVAIKVFWKQRLVLIALMMGLLSSPAVAQIVITGHGLFKDCSDAFSYRDGALVQMLDGAFANYDQDVENRIQQTIQRFEQHRVDAENAYAAADADQKQRIAITVGKWVFVDILGGIALDSLPAGVTEGYSDAQIEIFKQTIAASNAIKADVAQSIVTGNPPDNILSDQAAGIVLGILGKYLGPVGSFLTSVGQVSVGVATDYWETQPIKDVAAQEVAIFARAIEKMHAKSKAEKIAEINAVKNQIDEACVN